MASSKSVISNLLAIYGWSRTSCETVMQGHKGVHSHNLKTLFIEKMASDQSTTAGFWSKSVAVIIFQTVSLTVNQQTINTRDEYTTSSYLGHRKYWGLGGLFLLKKNLWSFCPFEQAYKSSHARYMFLLPSSVRDWYNYLSWDVGDTFISSPFLGQAYSLQCPGSCMYHRNWVGSIGFPSHKAFQPGLISPQVN